MAPANLGDLVPLGQALMNFTWWGYVTDIDTPTGVWATMEAVGDEAFVTMDVLQGPRGFPGQNAPLVTIKWAPEIVTVGDLPIDGGDFEINDGLWIGDLVYIWTGDPGEGFGWIPKRPGPAGPRGKTPIISVSQEVVVWEDQTEGHEYEADIAGTAEEPHITLQVPQGRPGPPGPASAIRLALDYEEPDGIHDRDFPMWNDTTGKWNPVSIDNMRIPRFFTVPEGAFTNFSGVAQRQQILAFPMPSLPFDWIPYVLGHIRAFGLEVDSDPLTIGAEIRLGDPTAGQLVARGFGNSSSWTTFAPHFSTPTSSLDAVTPDGTTGRVPAYHTGAAGTLYCNLYNDGLFGIYNFNKKGSQLTVMAIPVG